MFANNHKGTILIIAMIIGAGMLVAAVEVSMFVANTIRQARAIDHTLVAQYAAESATESALHQIRKEGRNDLRDDAKQSPTLYHVDARDASWSFLPTGASSGAPDPNKFNATVQKITLSRLREQESFDVHLWRQDVGGFSSNLNDFATLTVRWKKAECADPGVQPWIEATALAFSLFGSSVQWNDTVQAPVTTKQFKSPDSLTPRSISFAVTTFLPEGQSLDNKGMTLRIKPFFCALRGVELFFQKSDGTILAIPNYYLIRPRGMFGALSKDLQVIAPVLQGMTGIFDYLLFSDETLEKIEQ